MAITGLSNQQLLTLIIFVGTGAFVFAAIFTVASTMYLRKRRQKEPDAIEAGRGTHPAPVSPVAGGGQKQTMGSLLKSTGSNIQKPDSQKRGAAAQPGSPSDSAAWQEALRVLVNPQTQEIMVEVAGQRFSRISQVHDKMVGRRILESAAALLKFTGGLIATAGGIKSAPAPEVRLTAWPVAPAGAEKPAPAPPPKPASAPTDEIGQAFLSQLESKTESLRRSSTPVAPMLKPKGFFGRRKKADPAPEPEAASFDLAGQIDDLLQQKLAQNRIAVKTKIHSGIGGAIRIQVGEEFYNSVDEVTDAQIRALIKAAIDEWNR